jgi:ABC-2 type transport system permease protein
MSKLTKVIVHEFKMVAANKAFAVLTVLGPFLIVAVSVLPAVFSTRAEIQEVEIALLGADSELMQSIGKPLEASNIRVFSSTAERESLDALVLDGQLYGYVLIPENLLSAQKLTIHTKDLADYRVVEVLRRVIGQEIIGRRLSREGMDPQLVNRLSYSPQIETLRLSRKGDRVEGERQDFMSALLTGIAFTIMLYGTILIYSQTIGRSVLNEKVYKTVEIVLSSVSSRDLLFGKILGHGLASLSQYVVWIGMGMLLLNVLKPLIGGAVIPQIPLSLVGYLLAFFLLGFFLYTAIFAALGAAAQDESNFGQLIWPVILFLVIPMVGVSAIITNPNSTFSIALSLFPMTAAIVIFVRMVVSNPPAWQIALSAVLQAVTVLSAVLLSAKIFRVGILMTGKRLKVKEIMKWLKA